jgi:hypothetical protein
MRNKLLKIAGASLGLAAVLCAGAGCKSSGSEYISPRVEGRVLDADTRQPIYRARVKRITPGSQSTDNFMRKGGQRMEEPFPEYTNQEGYFTIDSERALVLFAQMNWFSVDVSFEHSGYDRIVTNYTLFNATNTPGGEPLIKTGDVLLHRTQSKQKNKPL